MIGRWGQRGERPSTARARPVRILRIIARLNTGGPAIHAVLLTRGLNSGRWASKLVTGMVGPTEGDMRYYADQMSVTRLVIPELGRAVAVGSDIRASVKVFRLLRRERPDIIHTHTAKAGGLGRVAGFLYNALARLTGRRPAKLVHTFHGHVFAGYFSPFRSHLMVVAERLLARLTDRIIAVSESVRQDLVRQYRICPPEKVTVVPLGLDFGWVESIGDHMGELRAAFGVPAEVVAIGIVGRLTAVKNHRLLLEATHALGRKDVRVLVVGDGELRRELEEAVGTLGLDGVVIFAGWQRDHARIYGDLDIVCLVSHNEGTPVALIEAMAAGRPFVATRVGGVPDLVIGKGARHPAGFEVFANGILVPPDDRPTLALALSYLIDRPAVRRAMGVAGRAHALRGFSADRLCRDTERVYAGLLERDRRGP